MSVLCMGTKCMMGVALLGSNPMNSIGRNGLESRNIDSQSEGCEFKS